MEEQKNQVSIFQDSPRIGEQLIVFWIGSTAGPVLVQVLIKLNSFSKFRLDH